MSRKLTAVLKDTTGSGRHRNRSHGSLAYVSDLSLKEVTMTIAAAKKHLRSIRYDQVKIMQLMNKRDELRLSLYPKAITYDGDRVQTTPEDVFSERVSALLEIEDKITRVGYMLDVKIVKTRAVIRDIPDDRCRDLLTLYYTSLTQEGRLYRWDDVAGEIGRATTYIIQKLHPKALEYYANYSPNILT